MLECGVGGDAIWSKRVVIVGRFRHVKLMWGVLECYKLQWFGCPERSVAAVWWAITMISVRWNIHHALPTFILDSQRIMWIPSFQGTFLPVNDLATDLLFPFADNGRITKSQYRYGHCSTFHYHMGGSWITRVHEWAVPSNHGNQEQQQNGVIISLWIRKIDLTVTQHYGAKSLKVQSRHMKDHWNRNNKSQPYIWDGWLLVEIR